MIKISPSLASAPLTCLAEVVSQLEEAQPDSLHFDVEDGTFVPVMTLGTKILSDLRPLTALPFDVHLMMVRPEWIIPQLIEQGAGSLSVHYEACPYPRRTLRLINEGGAQAGLAFNPATPLPDLAYLRPYLSFVVLLTSEPEVPDSPFLPETLAKVHQLRAMDGMQAIELVLDGGINLQNIAMVPAGLVDRLVVGRAAFLDGQPGENLRRLRAALVTNMDSFFADE